jgi:hypothetical protein
MTPLSEKDYRASNITMFILSTIWKFSTRDDRGRGLPSFLPLARTDLLNSIRLLDHLWQWKASLNRLMVAAHQVGEMMTWELFIKEGLIFVWLAESGGHIICQKLLWFILSSNLFSSKCDIEHTTESTVVAQHIDQIDQLPTSKPYQSRFL